jgi:hypothetical protein
MIEVRCNGNFFDSPILAGAAKLAFKSMIEGFVKQGHAKPTQAERQMAKGSNTALGQADQGALSSMWGRAITAEESDR